MTPPQYICHLQKWVDSNFETQTEAAKFINCSRASLNAVLNGKSEPMAKMLKATGHYRKQTIKTQYLRSM